MRILLAVHHYPPQRVAGAELYAYRVARGLLVRGHRVQVVCVDAIDEARYNGAIGWSDEVYDEIPVRRLSFNLAACADPLRASFSHPLLHAHFVELLRAQSPELLHLVSGYLLGVAPLQAARRQGIPTVVTLTDFWFLCPTIQLLRGDGSLCHGPEPLECARCLYDEKRRYRWLDQHAPWLMQNFWRAANALPPLGARFDLPARVQTLDARRARLRDVLNSADVIAPVTQFLARLYAENGADASRFVVTPYGVALESAPAVRADDGTIHFGYLGQLAPVKGVDLLLGAFRQLKRTRRARLTLHGSLSAFPDYVRRLRQIAADDPDIIFAGAYAPGALPNILGDLDMIVVPSRWYENSPHVILEAFAARRPVIGTNVGGIAEITQHEVSGLLFGRNDAADLARQMQRVLNEPDLLPRLRDGIPVVRTPAQELDQLLAVYEQAGRAHLDALARVVTR